MNNIKIDNILLGQDIEDLYLSKYESRDKYDNEYNYQFKELQIRTNNNNIDKIWLNISEYDFLSIDGKNNFKKINQITAILGSNYKEYWYDKEQGLKSHEYIDREAKIKINFIYNDLSEKQKELVWVILEKQK
ncbi:MAG: hypothetical protein ACRCXA_11940 [Peptostreptococcaceae bacterium]